jgi:hypothetical protein
MIQSLILAAVLLLMGFHTVMLGFLADLLAVNRKLLEELQLAERKRSLGYLPDKPPPSSFSQTREKLAQGSSTI